MSASVGGEAERVLESVSDLIKPVTEVASEVVEGAGKVAAEVISEVLPENKSEKSNWLFMALGLAVIAGAAYLFLNKSSEKKETQREGGDAPSRIPTVGLTGF